jgi:hypothetical protein
MTKSLLTGMAVCVALAAFAGNANAYRHKAPVYKPGPAPAMSRLMAKGGPLHDCVHVTFPQCDKGYGGPND